MEKKIFQKRSSGIDFIFKKEIKKEWISNWNWTNCSGADFISLWTKTSSEENSNPDYLKMLEVIEFLYSALDGLDRDARFSILELRPYSDGLCASRRSLSWISRDAIRNVENVTKNTPTIIELDVAMTKDVYLSWCMIDALGAHDHCKGKSVKWRTNTFRPISWRWDWNLTDSQFQLKKH